MTNRSNESLFDFFCCMFIFISIFQHLSVKSIRTTKHLLKELLFCSWLVAENSIDMNRICKNDDLEFKIENILVEGILSYLISIYISHGRKYVFQFPINTYISTLFVCVFYDFLIKSTFKDMFVKEKHTF